MTVFNKIYNNNLFIQVGNKAFDGNKEERLTVEELFIYGYLSTKKMYDESVETSITQITEILNKFNFKFHSKESTNKSRVNTLIHSLNKKGYINIITDGEKISNNSILLITFNKNEEGFEKIKYSDFYNIIDPIQFYMFAFIHRFGKEKQSGTTISDNQWRDRIMLTFSGKSEKLAKETVRKNIEELEKEGLITKHSGRYYQDGNRVKQEKNTYFIGSKEQDEFNFPDEVKEEVQPIQIKEPSHDVEVQEKEENKEERSHNWYVANSRLTDDDFYIYLTTQDEKLKEHCDRRIKAISKTDKGRSLVMALKGKAESIINKKEMEKEIMNAKSEMYVAKLENKREVKYKKKKFDDDISGFLDDFQIDIEEQQPKQNREPKFLEPEFDEFEEEYEKARKEHEAKMYLPDNDDLDDFNWGGEDPTNFNEFEENESAEYQELQMQINYM